jgi:alpha-tubulin suppressor-like RCC1 family protein
MVREGTGGSSSRLEGLGPAARLGVALLAAALGCGDDAAPVDGGGGGEAATACSADAMCDDGLFCNGVERCAPGAAGADAFGCTRADVPCVAGQRCDEEADQCLSNCSVAPDADGDGADAIECGGTDCADTNAARYPGATEVCDAANVDEDCDPTTFGDRDADGDTYVDATCCNDDAGTMRCGDDCSDSRRDMHPGLAEACDYLDNDCDATIDEVVAVPGFADEDRDLHGDPDAPLTACPDTPGFSTTSDDCDDMDPEVYGGLLEICDAKDNDCDELTDETPAAVTWYADDDADGFGVDGSRTVVSCTPVPDFSLRSSDCDDMDRLRSPVARELCNGEDDDCDGTADFMIRPGDLEDDDGDGFADMVCGGADCDDRSAAVHPGAPEICDGVDNDCNGVADGADAMAMWYLDLDGDGFGDGSAPAITDCEPQPGRVPRAGDCNDLLAAIRPGVSDTCDSVDADCDGATDEDSVRFAYYVDSDGDGFGLSTGPIVFACVMPPGRSLAPGDCEDGSATRHPGARELCNLADDDCDSRVDEEAPTTWYPDVDRDGHGVAAGAIVTCAPPAGYADVMDDCDDGNATRFPGNPELCDLVDNDCDAMVDDGASSACGVSHGTGSCGAGRCTISSCDAGYADCDARFDSGCEVDTARTATHCGGCGMRCGLGDTCGRITPSMCDRAPTQSMVAGDSQTLTFRSTGTLLGWGGGFNGLLGTGSTVNVPVAVPVAFDVTNASSGGRHSCLVTAARRLYCAGDNGYGQLGDGTTTGRTTFVLVPSLMNVVQVSTGQDHTCALRGDGTVWCWGRRNFGQTGDGLASPTPQTTPTMVPGIDDAVEVSVGLNHSCVRRPLGGGGFRIQCWGANSFGTVGDGTTIHRPSPTDVVGLPSDLVGFLYGYSDHNCVRLSSGGVRCWGGSGFGALGNGDTGRENATPGAVAMTQMGGAEATDIVGGASGWFLTCVLRDRGAAAVGHELWCTGHDDVGQIGDGLTTTSGAVGRLQPVVSESGSGVLDGITHVSCGRRFACATRFDGRVLCWGTDEFENLGNGPGVSAAAHTPIFASGF